MNSALHPSLPVGTQFEYEGKCYVVAREENCHGCAFKNKAACMNSPRCTADGINPPRIFVHLEEGVARKLLGELG